MPAKLHGMQSFLMAWQHSLAVLAEEVFFELFDNSGEENHWPPPHANPTLLIREFTTWRALFSVLLVRWVYLEVVRILV